VLNGGIQVKLSPLSIAKICIGMGKKKHRLRPSEIKNATISEVAEAIVDYTVDVEQLKGTSSDDYAKGKKVIKYLTASLRVKKALKYRAQVSDEMLELDENINKKRQDKLDQKAAKVFAKDIMKDFNIN
tara:strand:- start:14956 stop:15342 length:387 start_codon:yes stop_codon:yes gene_type:complete